MAVQVRQEINLGLGEFTTTATSGNYSPWGSGTAGGSRTQLDTTQYSGSVTYYFEVVGYAPSGGSGTVKLVRSASPTTADATAVISNTSVGRTRVAFTPPAGQTEYEIQFTTSATGSGTWSLKTARIVVLQNSPSFLSTESQFEIGTMNSNVTATTATMDSSGKYWTYTAADWSGSPTFYVESNYYSSNSKSAITVLLYQDDGTFANWTTAATIANASLASTTTRTRVAFTPVDGRHYAVAYFVGNGRYGGNVFSTKIIVDQVGGTADANPNNGSTYNFTSAYILAQAFKGDGNTLLGLSVNIAGSASGTMTGTAYAYIYADSGATYGTNDAPASNPTILATSDPLDMSTIAPSTTSNYLFTFSGANAITLGNGTAYELGIDFRGWNNQGSMTLPTMNWGVAAGSGGSRATSSDGGVTWSTFTGAFAFQIFTSQITKWESQYMLFMMKNVPTDATGVQGYNNLYDPSEWSNVTGSYVHAIDSNASGTSAAVNDATAVADLSGSTATSSAAGNQTVSGAFTLPSTADDLDTDILALPSTSSLSGSRLIGTMALVTSLPPLSINFAPGALGSITGVAIR